MNIPTLYGITAELNVILAQLEELGGEITPELEQALAINEDNFAAKSEDYGHAILNLKAMQPPPRRRRTASPAASMTFGRLATL